MQADTTLTLTAAQANGLEIIADPSIITDKDDPNYDEDAVPVVNIINLGTAVYDFSGIDADIAGVVTLAPTASTTDNPLAADVTLNQATDLGAFTVQLTVYDLGDEVLLARRSATRMSPRLTMLLKLSQEGLLLRVLWTPILLPAPTTPTLSGSSKTSPHRSTRASTPTIWAVSGSPMPSLMARAVTLKTSSPRCRTQSFVPPSPMPVCSTPCWLLPQSTVRSRLKAS